LNFELHQNLFPPQSFIAANSPNVMPNQRIAPVQNENQPNVILSSKLM